MGRRKLNKEYSIKLTHSEFGDYYFDENGRLVTEPGIHSLEMDCYEMNFDGSYYFGGTNGALLQGSTVTDDGFIVDDTGKIVNMDDADRPVIILLLENKE